MKHPLSFTLEGKDWSRLYTWYWVPTLLLIFLSFAVRSPDAGAPNEEVFRSLLLSLAVSFLSLLVQAFFTVPILRTWLPKASVEGRAFGFAGDTTDYMVLNVKGFFLSIVTLGFYLPWYYRNLLDYLARETTWNGASARFLGKPGRILGQVWIGIGLAIALTVVSVLALGTALGWRNLEPGVGLLTAVIVVLVVVPLMYLMYFWTVNFSWNGCTLRWKTRFWPAVGLIFGQVGLLIVTLGIAWPVVSVVLYRYFVQRTVVEEDGAERVTFVVEARPGEGFGFLWGQALLTLITLGFYGAWSGPRISRWFVERTFAVEAPRPEASVHPL